MFIIRRSVCQWPMTTPPIWLCIYAQSTTLTFTKMFSDCGVHVNATIVHICTQFASDWPTPIDANRRQRSMLVVMLFHWDWILFWKFLRATLVCYDPLRSKLRRSWMCVRNRPHSAEHYLAYVWNFGFFGPRGHCYFTHHSIIYYNAWYICSSGVPSHNTACHTNSHSTPHTQTHKHILYALVDDAIELYMNSYATILTRAT